LINPVSKQQHFGIGQRVPLADRRHLQIGLRVSDITDQRTFIGLPGNDRSADVSTGQAIPAVVQSIPGLWFFSAMAAETGSFKDGFDVASEAELFVDRSSSESVNAAKDQ
jgi:hypothetical protein